MMAVGWSKALSSAALAGLVLSGCGGGSGGSGGIGGSASTSSAKTAISDAAFSSPMLQASGDPPEVSPVAQVSDGSRLDLAGAATRLQGADPRNGNYAVFAANGTQQSLAINVDTKSYEMTDEAGQSTSGTFAEDFTEPGTYVFDTPRVTSAANPARFRITSEAVVGQFPFAVAYASPTAYAVQPFVGARSFLSSGAALDGTYNRLGISRNRNGTSDSQILAMRISGAGSLIEMCFDNTIYTFDACPSGSKRSYSLTVDSQAKWTGTNLANPDDKLGFRMTRIGGQNLYLSAGSSTLNPDARVFRLAMPESSQWPAIRTVGGSTLSTWGTTALDASTYKRAALYADGSYNTLAMPVTTLVAGPQGIRLLTNGDDRYFAIQGSGLAVVVGARGAPDTVGYAAIGLVDSNPPGDSRNGQYKVFATNGTQQTLKLNLDSKRYEMTDNAGATVAGSFTEDGAEAGTYVFATDRVTSAYNTARFRVTSDAIVGGFPFAVAYANPTTYAAQPFIAARTFVTRPADLDGAYNRLVVTRTSGAADSFITTFKIQNGGTGMVVCNSNQIFAIDACPAEFQVPYSISWDAANARWQAIRLDNPDPSQGQIFQIARIGGQNVQLRGAFGATQANTFFRIGLPESASWPSVTAHGHSTDGAWGSAVLDSSTNQRTSTDVNGTVGTLSFPVTPIAGPLALRGVNSTGSDKYFEARSSRLSVLIGARSNVNTQGYIQLNLVD